jgi:hypothetical protein
MIQDQGKIVIQDSDEDDECDGDQRLARRLAAQEAHQMLLQVSILLFFSSHSRAGQRSLGTGQSVNRGASQALWQACNGALHVMRLDHTRQEKQALSDVCI